jgi:hypothetical protein
MPEWPSSQSAISIKLNTLFDRMHSHPDEWPVTLLQDLQGVAGRPRRALIDIARDSTSGVVVADKQGEIEHIANWPADQQEAIRQALIFAVSHRRRLRFSVELGASETWVPRFGRNGDLYITFKGPPQ